MIKKQTLIKAFALAALVPFFAACGSEDELTDRGTSLIDGQYPLQIGAVTVTAEVSDGAQTRVAETDDGSGSVFENGDEITVQLGGETATYTYDGSSWTTDTQLYWTNTNQTLTAWYTSPEYTDEYGSVDLSDQTDGLAYSLRATADFAERVNLSFSHQLAKVRVVTKGTYDTSDAVIALTTPATTMHQTRYDGIGTCWEATVPPDTRITSVSIDGTECTLDGEGVTTVAGSLHTITLTAHQSGTTVVDLSEMNGQYNIGSGGIIYFTGEYNGRYSPVINISASSDIYFDNVTINASGNTAILILTNPTVTIHVAGENEINGAIFLDNGTLTIEGSGPDDVLSVTSDDIGIGGVMDGDIVIRNVTVRSTGGGTFPGIGFEIYMDGTITIEDATVYAYGGTFAPAIGSRLAGSISAQMTVNISNSEIHAHRGSPDSWNPDYIGWGEDGTGSINAGGGSITGSTVYCYTGETLDKTVVYDDGGTPAEQD